MQDVPGILANAERNWQQVLDEWATQKSRKLAVHDSIPQPVGGRSCRLYA